MTQTPADPHPNSGRDRRDDALLDWLTQDHRRSVDFAQLDDAQREAEAVAARYAAARLPRLEALPEDLAARLLADAPRHLTTRHLPTAKPASTPRRAWWHNLGLAWGSAAFASVVAVALALRLLTLPPALQGKLLLASDAGHYAWQPGPDGAGKTVAGEVIWDPGRGGGYIKLRGLPANDPRREQYQLWIFDGTRDQRYPVDGGVFNVRPDGQVEVWIRVPIPVRNAAMFAVTVEKAGGTVVSGRERIVALAKVGA